MTLIAKLDTVYDKFVSPVEKFWEKAVVTPVGEYLEEHPEVYKVVVLSIHFFQAAIMYTFMTFLPWSPVANFAVSFTASLFYQSTIQRRLCQFRFAVPACLGATAFQISKPTLQTLSVGLSSFKAFATTLAGVTPFALYVLTAIWLSTDAVTKKLELDKAGGSPSGSGACCASGAAATATA